MTGKAGSDAWARIAGLRPRLQSHLRWHRHYFRDRPWWLLQDPASGQHYHFTQNAHRFIALLDGRRTLKQAHATLADAGDDLPQPDEVVALVARLQAADLLRFEGPIEPEALFRRWRLQRGRQRRNSWLRPLSVRLPLVDPSRLLDVMLPLLRSLFGRVGFGLWLVLVLVALLLAAQHQPELAAHAASRFLDPANLLLLWLAYPLVKGLHELGHAGAIRAWGGNVRELGVMLLVFIPVPYVDGSDASAFPEKRRRVLVGAAGIMVEALLAALALFVWLTVQPGLLRDLAFDVMVIGGVSTLLFNGNPLLRFDGYFVLSDMLEIPNLARRAQQYYVYLAQRYLLGVSTAASPLVAQGERSWFLFYGLASTGYRLFISLVIALYLADTFFFLGVLLAGYVLFSFLMLPLGRVLRYLLSDPELRGHRLRAVAVGLGGTLALAGLLLGLPLPHASVAQGVLRVPEGAMIRVAESGEVAELVKTDGDTVRRGELLLRMSDPQLVARLQVLEARADELQARMERVTLSDRVQAAIVREQLEALADERTAVRRRLDNLQLFSPESGVIDLPLAVDLPGRFVEQGTALGLIRTREPASLRVVIDQEQAGLVRNQTKRIDVRLSDGSIQTLSTDGLRAVPAANHALPSAALGSQGGGMIAVDARDERGLTTLEPVFHFDLQLQAGDVTLLPGSRLHVRFQHPPEPLAPRWYRAVRRVLLARLEY